MWPEDEVRVASPYKGEREGTLPSHTYKDSVGHLQRTSSKRNSSAQDSKRYLSPYFLTSN